MTEMKRETKLYEYAFRVDIREPDVAFEVRLEELCASLRGCRTGILKHEAMAGDMIDVVTSIGIGPGNRRR